MTAPCSQRKKTAREKEKKQQEVKIWTNARARIADKHIFYLLQRIKLTGMKNMVHLLHLWAVTIKLVQLISSTFC